MFLIARVISPRFEIIFVLTGGSDVKNETSGVNDASERKIELKGLLRENNKDV